MQLYKTVLTAEDSSSRPLGLWGFGRPSSACPQRRSPPLGCSASPWRIPSSHPTCPTAHSGPYRPCPSPRPSPEGKKERDKRVEVLQGRKLPSKMNHIYDLPGHVSGEVAVGGELQMAAVPSGVVNYIYFAGLAGGKKDTIHFPINATSSCCVFGVMLSSLTWSIHSFPTIMLWTVVVTFFHV